jgi:hypothetical protein
MSLDASSLPPEMERTPLERDHYAKPSNHDNMEIVGCMHVLSESRKITA